MIDNIQKLYEIAGVDYEERYNNCTLNKEGECGFKGSCDICKYAEERYIYPTFTAEKQLKLIKWLASSRKGILISDMGEGEFNISTGFYYCAKHIMNFKNNKDLGIVIATFINDLWQDLTDDKKQEIKRILE